MPFLTKNQTVELFIDGYTAEGAGVGHLDGFAVFVSGALKGETVRCLVIKSSRRYAVAKLVSVLVASPHRAEPPCPQYARCGGCALQHMQYAEQLRFKQQRILDAFARIGGLDVSVPPVLGMETPLRYRNKGAFPAGPDGSGAALGLYAARSHRLVPLTDCLLQSPDTQQILTAVRTYLTRCHIPVYDESTHTGALRHVVTRHNETGECLVCLVSRTPLPQPEVLTGLLRGALPGLVGIVENINPQKTNAIFGEQERLVYGKAALTLTLCGLRFEVSARSFFQINLGQANVLYRQALALAGLTGSETVVDAYCGVGSMSLLFARHAKEVIGIECVAAAVDNARDNARLNGQNNARFLCEQAERALPRLCSQGLRPDVLLLDPPRKGCDPAVLRAAAQSGVPKIVYVSCDPATQARDAALLAALGYACGPVQGVDMFCQTAHVESVCLFSRQDSRAVPPVGPS